MKKMFTYSCLAIWTIGVIIGAYPNANHYSVLDWIVVITIYVIPCSILIAFNKLTSKRHKKNSTMSIQNSSLHNDFSNEHNCLQKNVVKLENSSYSELDLLAWQNILYPDTTLLKFNAYQLKQLSASVILQQSEIAHDCMGLINTTKIPETFFSRYDLLIEKLTLLSNLEKYVKFNTYSPTQQLASAMNKKTQATNRLIDRYLFSTASNTKSSKTQFDLYQTHYDTLLCYSAKMTEESLFYLKNKYQTIINDSNEEYLSTVLPNDKTIREQQEIDYKKTQGIYPSNTPRFLDMWIFSNTVPPKENYSVLNEDEKKFFYCFHSLLIKASLDPSSIQLTRLSSGTFDVKYVHLCYVGKIDLYQSSPTYAVIKKGNKKATKIFSSNDEAKRYIVGKPNYTIDIRQAKTSFYMQYEDDYSTKELWNLTLEQYISYIPYWILHIKNCLNERLEWLS